MCHTEHEADMQTFWARAVYKGRRTIAQRVAILVQEFDARVINVASVMVHGEIAGRLFVKAKVRILGQVLAQLCNKGVIRCLHATTFISAL